MEKHLKKMREEWRSNTRKYRDPIGMTGRRPDDGEFNETIRDVASKFNVSDPSIQNILDVGCNNGYLLKRLNSRAPIRVGIDFCFEPLLEGKRLHPEMQFIQGEVTRLPLPDNTFDRVLCYNMFHYLKSQESGLEAGRELYRVLKYGGRLLIGDLFTEEHRHLIPEADRERWDSSDRPYMHRMRNWMFISINALEEMFETLAPRHIRVTPQHGNIRCPGYRYDIIIDK